MPRDPFDQPTLHGSQDGRYQPGLKVFSGRFVLERRIGRGGMGEVWLATDTELGDGRALKFLPSEVAADPKALAQLRREAIAGRRLSHPRIVRVDDFYSDAAAGMAAVAMEYVEGRTLNELQAETEKGYFEVAEIEGWIRDVCEALEYAHGEAKVVHRDLKPSNVIIEKATGRAKVLDFGIARRIAETHTQLTGKDSSGTLAYMSPQQVDGERGLPSDDVYALGATIYELLTGTPPFFRGDLRQQINMKVPPSMTARRAELADEGMILEGGSLILASWERGVAACLAKEAGRRPGSAAEVMRRLIGVAEQPTPAPAEPAARPAPVAAPASAPVQQEPAAGRAAAAIEKAPESSRGRKPPVRAIAMAAVLVLGVMGLAGWMLSGGDKTAKPDPPALSDRSDRSDPSRVAAPPEPPAIRQAGAVRITSTPGGAEVWEGNRRIDTTPATIRNVKHGTRVSYVLKKEGYEEADVSGTLKVGEGLELSGTLLEKSRGPSLANGKIGDDLKFPIGSGEVIVLKFIPGGEFFMGSSEREAASALQGKQHIETIKGPLGIVNDVAEIAVVDEKTHRVIISSNFWMGETEITQGQWEAVMGKDRDIGSRYYIFAPREPRRAVGKDFPMYYVGWDDAKQFVEKLNSHVPLPEGWNWALPTEAQWERACRGGTDSATAYGDSISANQASIHGVMPFGDMDLQGFGNNGPGEVGKYKKNPYGLLDVHGNVWEWCENWYGVYPSELIADPIGPSTGSKRVIRGGGWRSPGINSRSAARGALAPDFPSEDVGFRVVAVPSR